MVGVKQSPYEEFRLRRVEENKKRMEALNLPKLCQNLNSISVKTSPVLILSLFKIRMIITLAIDICFDLSVCKLIWQMKKCSSPRSREKQEVVVRRSSRLSNATSSPVYKEVVVVQRVRISRRVSKGRDFSNRVYVSEEIREEAISRAEKLQADLGSSFPSFVKSMLQSHVSGGFWLGLPVQFCRSQLQKKDGIITLIDEEGEEFETVYLARKTGLSGGWMGFAVAHNLAYGDALVFHLLRPSVFKVYIIRVGSSGENSKI